MRIFFLVLALFVTACFDDNKVDQGSDVGETRNQEIVQNQEIIQGQENLDNKNEVKQDDIKLVGVDGKEIIVSNENGGFKLKDNDKANLFVFFATWCAPCRAEIPQLNAIRERYSDKLNLVAVLLDNQDKENIQDFVDRFKIKYDVVIGDENSKFERAVGGVIGLPFSILYDGSGKLVKKHIGLVPEEMLNKNIEKAIEG